MRRVHPFPIILLVLLPLVAGCTSRQNGASLENVVSPVVFRLGAVNYTVADFSGRMEQEFGGAITSLLAQGQTPEQVQQLADQQDVRRTLFENVIQEELLVQVARQEGIGVDPREVDLLLAQEGESVSLWEDGGAAFGALTSQRVNFARQQLIATVVAQHTTADMFRARQIVVVDEASADKALAALSAGRPFVEVAQEFAPDRPGRDADIGWNPRGNLPPELEQAGFNGPLNTPAKYQVQGTWMVFEVLERQGSRPFDSIDHLRASTNGSEFYDQTFLPWYNQLRADAEASGVLAITPGFNPNSVPLTFPK